MNEKEALFCSSKEYFIGDITEEVHGNTKYKLVQLNEFSKMIWAIDIF